jgi:hypothetical protein
MLYLNKIFYVGEKGVIVGNFVWLDIITMKQYGRGTSTNKSKQN